MILSMERLGPDEVRVVRVAVDRDDADVDRWAERLPPLERNRLEGYRPGRERRRRTVARLALRSSIAAAVGIATTEVEIDTTDLGQPFLAGPELDPALWISMSHAGRFSFVALSHRRVGIDAERIRPLDVETTAPTLLSSSERAEIEIVEDEDERIRLLFRAWVRKESVLKALGFGLTRDPTEMVIAEIAPGSPEVMAPLPQRGRWILTDLDLGPKAVGCVASEGGSPPVVYDWAAPID